MPERVKSSTLFCSTCGAPAEKHEPPKNVNPNWKPRWQKGCAHVGEPVRMGPKRAQRVREEFVKVRDIRLGKAKRPVADCSGKER